MALKSNGFIFPIDPLFNSLFDNFFNNCVPLTVGIGNKVPVTVRVRQGVTVRQSQSQAVPNTIPSTIRLTVQQETVYVPVQQGTVNPAQQRQTVGQEIVVGEPQTLGNQALESFNDEASVENSTGTTLLLPQGTKSDVAQASKILRALGREVAAIASANKQLAEEAVQAAASTIDDAVLLANKLKNLPLAAQQQLLQKANLPFDAIRNIVNNPGQAANILRQQGVSKIAEINQAVTLQGQRIVASLC